MNLRKIFLLIFPYLFSCVCPRLEWKWPKHVDGRLVILNLRKLRCFLVQVRTSKLTPKERGKTAYQSRAGQIARIHSAEKTQLLWAKCMPCNCKILIRGRFLLYELSLAAMQPACRIWAVCRQDVDMLLVFFSRLTPRILSITAHYKLSGEKEGLVSNRPCFRVLTKKIRVGRL